MSINPFLLNGFEWNEAAFKRYFGNENINAQNQPVIHKLGKPGSVMVKISETLEAPVELVIKLDKKTEKKKKRKASKSRQFVASSEWKSLRLIALAKHGKICMKCGSKEKIQVDHIYPKSKYPELALEFSNLQILCWSCNKQKAARHSEDYRKQPILI